MKKLIIFFTQLTFILFSVSMFAQTIIQDADGNTSVETERFPNDDVIRFQLGGTDVMQLKNRTLSIFNSGNSVFLGQDAGISDDLTNNKNIFIGREAGRNNTTGQTNVAIGRSALKENIIGFNNMALGAHAMQFSTKSNNVAIGTFAMNQQTDGENNVGIGSGANYFNTSGSNNVMIGLNAGRGTSAHSKSGNVFIGANAGFNETGSNKLYIDNSNTSNPLLYGDFSTDQIAINTSTPSSGYALSVNGKGVFTEVRVLEFVNWPDYVFKPEYDLKTLEEIDNYIQKNGHLPNIPSAQKVEQEGILLGDMQKNLVEKIEEMTLYLIDINEKVKKLEAENVQLKAQIHALEK